jgi:WD40 repeat protein
MFEIPAKAILRGGSDGVACVAYSHDGRLFASGACDGSVRLWDSSTRHQLAVLGSHGCGVLLITFLTDDRILATASVDRQMKLWDVGTGSQLAGTQVPETGWLPFLAFTPRSNLWALVKGRRSVQLLDIKGKSRSVFKAPPDRELYELAFSADGGTLAACSQKRIIHWDVATTRQLRSWDWGGTESGSAFALAFAPNGKMLASSAAADLKQLDDVKIWDVATGSLRATLCGHTDSIFALAFNPDGTTLASGSCDNTVKLWDLATGEELSTLVGHTDMIHGLAFSPDGRTLAKPQTDALERNLRVHPLPVLAAG